MSVLVASVVAVAGLWYSGVQTRQTNEQARDERALVKEGQITDRYTAAVANLGEDTLDVRLGGIYALERIMQDSSRGQPTIANVLAAYIRTHAAEPPGKGKRVPADVHAALVVLANRDQTHDKGFYPDLRSARLPGIEFIGPSRRATGADLSEANLSGADLSGADLRETDLSNADLSDANLLSATMFKVDLSNATLARSTIEGVVLAEANLHRADLSRADLSGSALVGANLTEAALDEVTGAGVQLSSANLTRPSLRDARLSRVDLRGANLTDADLRGAKLSDVVGLTQRQVDSAITDGTTKLPPPLSP
ncbi:pentapeptide repeat-containing protein [Streptomyces arboris]|uniref:pentapeptide repeat-containing protein n=1 Tax=Streptomyces arboris TaxID=2600619 RepID=UPI003BF536D6